MDDLARRAAAMLDEAVEDARVVVVEGPRQAGKTTLLRQFVQRAVPVPRYVTLDDPAELAAATADPVGYLTALGRPLVIDEYQRAGESLVLAIKMQVDQERSKGQYVLAGSTTFLTTRQLSETLAGRVAFVPVWPLSQGEIRGRHETFLERIVRGDLPVGRRYDTTSRSELARIISTGGFPESVLAPSDRARSRFLTSYVTTVVGRESVADAGERRDPALLQRSVRALGARTAGELNVADLSADTGLDRRTIDGHVQLLATLRQLLVLPGWETSATTRAKRRSKVVLADSGVACVLLEQDVADLSDPRSREFGPLLETFVIGELVRQAAWLEGVRLLHYRDRDGREVDLIIETGRGNVVGIEVKATATVTPAAASGLRYVAERAGHRWRGGIVLHTGPVEVPLGDGIRGIPLPALWS